MPGTTFPPVHLWIFNHPFHGISDQVDFFVSAYAQHGYPVSVGRQPRPNALNVVIENFSADSKATLTQFCKAHRKRVAVIMTEHLDFEDDRILIHGAPLWSDNDYMHPATQLERIKNLIDCLPYLRGFLVLGDLPELRNMTKMLPGIDIRTIPFPGLEPITPESAPGDRPGPNDLLFTGFMTDYRRNVLANLYSGGFNVECPRRFVSRRRRDMLTRSVKLALNIPQREDWRWLSLMRIIAALRSGRATVSLGTLDTSRIASSCVQIDLADNQWQDNLRALVEDWRGLNDRCAAAYATMCNEFEREFPFPHDAMEFWAITDRISC
jgi:hypothetical protein